MIQEKTRSEYATRTITTIDKRDHISHKELIREYIEPGIPVIVKDIASNWEGMGKLTPEFFKTHYGHIVKKINGVEYEMSTFVDLMMKATPEHPAPYPYNFNIEDYFPELMKYIHPQIAYGKYDRINHPLLPRFMMKGTEIYEIFLGGNGSFFPHLHFDALFCHTQITQLYGSKEFIMFSPDQTIYMYPKEDNHKISQVDYFNPDYDRFPLFREVRPVTITVEEGETLFFPSGWWHTTRIHEPCISFGRAQLNGSNWNLYIKDEYRAWKKYPFVAISVYLYGKLLGQIMNLQEKFIPVH